MSDGITQSDPLNISSNGFVHTRIEVTWNRPFPCHTEEFFREVASNVGKDYQRIVYERYPHRDHHLGRQDLGIFAVRLFNTEIEEIGYWIPDLGYAILFDVARVWAEEYKTCLGLTPMDLEPEVTPCCAVTGCDEEAVPWDNTTPPHEHALCRRHQGEAGKLWQWLCPNERCNHFWITDVDLKKTGGTCPHCNEGYIGP